MNCVDVFMFKTSVDKFANAPISVQKKAVSDFSREFVSAHVLQITGIPVNELEYVYGVHGKPYIKGNPLYFNVSHCGNVILSAFASEEIGVDIEIVRKFNNAVPRRFFTDEERDYMDMSFDEAEADRRFFEIWTAKEAFLKLLGVGISGGFDFCTADEKGVRTDVFSPKFGNAKIIHRGVETELCKNDIVLNNIPRSDNFVYEYQISVCGREINEINLQLI